MGCCTAHGEPDCTWDNVPSAYCCYQVSIRFSPLLVAMPLRRCPHQSEESPTAVACNRRNNPFVTPHGSPLPCSTWTGRVVRLTAVKESSFGLLFEAGLHEAQEQGRDTGNGYPPDEQGHSRPDRLGPSRAPPFLGRPTEPSEGRRLRLGAQTTEASHWESCGLLRVAAELQWPGAVR